MRRPLYRASLVATGLAAAVALTGPPASAHNGVGAAFKGAAGPYTVYAYDGSLVDGDQVEYRVVLLSRSTGAPAYDVTTRISASRGPHHEVQAQASIDTFGNVVLYRLPNAYPDDWRVEVRLTGRAGSGHVHFPMHGIAAAPDPAATVVSVDQPSPWPWVGAAVAAVAIIGAAAWWLRRRRPG